MKDLFPFTDYDFYSYVACGIVVVFGVDYWHSGGDLLHHDNWTFFQGALLLSLSYVAGQIIAIPSSILIEHTLTRRVLRAPAVLLLSTNHYCSERFIEHFLIGRHYAPLPDAAIEKIFKRAEKETGLTRDKLEKNLQEVFGPALIFARSISTVNEKIDFFRNQYSFSRNMALSCILLGFLFTTSYLNGHIEVFKWAALSILIAVGMTIRFLKFYSCCAAEVLRAYAYSDNMFKSEEPIRPGT